jgi:hypothetical protein
VAGKVTAVRFYKGSHNTGTHTGQLWSSSGTKLAEVRFATETASGWQQANFATPVSISANTTYVVSYFAPVGRYAHDEYYPWSTVSSSPLRVAGSAPGVFSWGSWDVFPANAWRSSNYWVDLVFVPDSGSSGFMISGKVTGAPATLTLSGAAGAVTATDASGNYNFTGLANGAYVVAPSRTGYSFSPSTKSVAVNGANVSNINFNATPVAVTHSVTLSWVASSSTGVVGYNVYRSTVSGGPYTKVNGGLVAGTSWIDYNVVAGQTYYYVATSVNSSNTESSFSTGVSANVPL